jgi:hypothetical protein
MTMMSGWTMSSIQQDCSLWLAKIHLDQVTRDVRGMEIAVQPGKWHSTEWRKGGKSWQAYERLKC